MAAFKPTVGEPAVAAPASDVLDAASLRRLALTSMVATSIEFYDFFIFATAAALIFPTICFPDGIAPLVAQIAAYSTLAVGFFARPVGAAIFGHFGDRVGRKSVLVIALMLMGASTTLIGLLPSYHSIGNAAPLLLVALRVVQGFALGGQWGGAVLIIIENAPADKRGWYGGFAQVGAPVGTVLANLAFLAVSLGTSAEDFAAWGWRIPFLASVVLVGLSLFIHTRMDETPAFQKARAAAAQAPEKRSPVITAIVQHPREILLAAGAFIGMQAAYYILISFSLTYGADPAGVALPRNVMLTAVLAGAVAMVPGVFIGASLSDRIGRRPVIIVSAGLLALWSFAIFPLIGTSAFGFAALALCVGQFLNGMIFGPLAALYTEFFPTRMRYSGMSLGYQLGTLIGGALAPLIATALFASFGSTVPISAYMAATCLLSLASAWFITETRGRILS